jgi:hypothetical protein
MKRSGFGILIPFFKNVALSKIDAPANSWIDSTSTPKVKTTEGQGVRARSLAHSILGVEGRAGASGWGLGRVTSESIIHIDLYKPNNKLVSA